MKRVKSKMLEKSGRMDGELSYISWTGDGEGRRVATRFISEVITGACHRSMDHWHGLKALGQGEESHPLRCHERMFYSTFAAAISDVTPIHLSELPISRKTRGVDAKAGRADFWARHGQNNFFIELKRTTIGVRTSWSDKKLDKKMALVEQQAKQLKREAKDWSESGAGKCVLIGLQVILPYSDRGGDKLANQKHFIPEVGERHGRGLVDSARTLDRSVDFCAVWTPPTNARQFEFEIDGSSRTEWNPYVGFVAKILFQ